MRIVVTFLLTILFSSAHVCFAENTVKLNEATVSGVKVKIGEGADIVQSRIKADKFVTSGYNYGDPSKGYYNDNGVTYIITYGTPKSGSGGYIVKQIEQIKSNKEIQKSPTLTTTPQQPGKLTRDQVIESRQKFKIKVVSFDATQEFGAEFPYSDFVRLKITNNSKFVLPSLTVLTKRLDGNGKMIGSSRAPSIPVSDLKPGQSAEVDYYPRGHVSGVKKITVEIESLISPENEKFFAELSPK